MNTDFAKIVSVSELTHSIKSLLELQYRFVHIRGEVSNLRSPLSGHLYFTLKDEKAQIRAVLCKGQQRYLQKQIEEGQAIVCHGRISLYEPRGEYQIIVDTVEHSGTGELQRKYELLKNQLQEEGLFREERKKSLPQFPEHVAVITSPTGAALQDFLKVADHRNYYGKITVIAASVQGKNSSPEIVKAIETACRETSAEIIVLIRGGGSLEDLWSFNEEETARAISASSLPIVTGVGHEIDFTIADLCADVRAHTPTAAAELLLPDSDYLLEVISQYKKRFSSALLSTISSHQMHVNQQLRIIGDLDLYLSHFSLKVDHQVSRLIHLMQQAVQHSSNRLKQQTEKLKSLSPAEGLELKKQKLAYLYKELFTSHLRNIEKKEEYLRSVSTLLDSVSPLKVLSRGYSVVRKNDGSVVSDAAQVSKGDPINVRLDRGQLACEVISTFKGDQKD